MIEHDIAKAEQRHTETVRGRCQKNLYNTIGINELYYAYYNIHV